jgi:hypothetical protein
MPSPYEAPCLARLKQALNTRWPNRDRSSDGWIGDLAHQSRISDHNPDKKTGVVRARDVDKDGVHRPTVTASLLAHPSTRYVISNARIFHIDDGFKPRAYSGTNLHHGHDHESIKHTLVAENSKAPWKFISSAPTWPLLREGMSGMAVFELQAYLNGHGGSLRLDSDFGDATDNTVRAFQKSKGLRVDGVVGPQTIQALRTR